MCPAAASAGAQEASVREQSLSTFDNNPALFTAVSGFASCGSHDFFEIVALRVARLKTFWTITRCQVIGIDGQMAMSATQPVVPFRQEHELAMRAGGHYASPLAFPLSPATTLRRVWRLSRLLTSRPLTHPAR